jgi:hypothetical protein
VNGGFVLIADAWRRHRELVAYDGAGRELERVDLAYLDPRYLCDKEPTCPPWPEPDPSPSGGLAYYKLREAFHDYRGWVPSEIEQWAARDGSGRVRTVQLRPGDEFVGARDAEKWGERGRVSDDRFGRGEARPLGYEGCLPPTHELPADPDRLAAVFGKVRAQCAEQVPLNAKSFEFAASVLLNAGASPELRAALYELVTRVDGVELIDDARDPLGRPATAAALDVDYGGRPERYVLFFDPETSQPLGFVEKLREPQDWMEGLLLSYRVVLDSGHVKSIESRP